MGISVRAVVWFGAQQRSQHLASKKTGLAGGIVDSDDGSENNGHPTRSAKREVKQRKTWHNSILMSASRVDDRGPRAVLAWARNGMELNHRQPA